jgi:hypothetical protein
MDSTAAIELVFDDYTEAFREQPRLEKVLPTEPSGDENGKHEYGETVSARRAPLRVLRGGV